MDIPEANIEIFRDNGSLSKISVIMPKWNTPEEDDSICGINIPLFGLKTFAKNEDDAKVAIKEAILCFCISAEKFGKGIEVELQALGWSLEEEDKNRVLLAYKVSSSDVVLEQIMQTGEPYSNDNLEITYEDTRISA